MVKLSSLHKTSGCVEPAGNEGDLGEWDGACIAVATMPHIGQPGFGEKDIISVACTRGRYGLEEGREASQVLVMNETRSSESCKG